MATTRTGTVNQTPATGAEAVYLAKTRVKTAGWTVPRSSDGTTYNSSGDQITSGSSGANGMANSLAWFVIEDPGTRRQFCFQKSSANNTSWRIKFSESAKFTGGSPGATQTPSATDEVVLWGAGTDAAPTMAQLFPTDGTYRFHCVADHAVITGTNAYQFWFGANLSGAQDCNTLFLADGLRSGSYDPTDTSPHYTFVNYDATYGSPGAYSNYAASTPVTYVKAWLKHGLGGAAYQTMCVSGFGASNVGYPCYTTTNQMGLWANANYDGGIEMFLGRTINNSDPDGPKGVPAGLKHAFYPRGFPHTVDLAGDDPKVYWNRQTGGGGVCLLIPWINTTAPSL